MDPAFAGSLNRHAGFPSQWRKPSAARRFLGTFIRRNKALTNAAPFWVAINASSIRSGANRPMEAMMSTIRRFLSDEHAATAIEYAIIGALVSIMIVVGARSIGTTLSAKFNAVSANLS
jgi:pilus assembly protein Flp/PilA